MSRTLQGHRTKLNSKRTTVSTGSGGQTTVMQYNHDRLVIRLPVAHFHVAATDSVPH